MAPSTFASAAAGSSSTPTRAENSSEWSRRPNGATQTFRRPSLATTLSSSSHMRDMNTNNSMHSPGVYVPPHANANRSSTSDQRYAKTQLLDLFKNLHESDSLADGLTSLYVDGWKPNIANGANHGWGRKEDAKDGHPGADVCWDRDGTVQPLCLSDLTEEEKEQFSTSVNSPLKPPVQNQNKDGTPKDGLTLRKASISNAQNSASYGLGSPTTTRPSNRRRDTSEAYPFPPGNAASPAGSRFFRDEGTAATPPAALLRRATGSRDVGPIPDAEERDKGKEKPREAGSEGAGPFGSFKRANTGGPFSAGVTGPSSPWSSTPQAGFGPMGSFGNFALGSSGAAAAPPEKRPGLASLRGESKFKGLMNKDISDEVSGKKLEEKSSISSLNKTSEAEPGRSTPSWMESRANRPMSNDTDPFPDDDMRAGSAALGGSHDAHGSAHAGAHSGFGTPVRQSSGDESGFGAFGMTSDTGFRDMMASRDPYAQFTPQQQRGNPGGNEPMSPTNTNPYQSPDHDKTASHDRDDDAHLPGLGGFSADHGPTGLPGLGAFGNLGRSQVPYEVAASDRSQTSSTGPGRGYPSLGGLGGLPGLGASPWASQQAIGTPSREKSSLGGPFGGYGTAAEAQSPSLAGLGANNNLFSGLGGGSGTIGRGSKMGSLFPAAMQEQMREQQRRSHDENSVDDNERPQSSFGGLGKDSFGNLGAGSAGPTRDAESPFRSNRGMFDELMGANLRGGTDSPYYGPEGISVPFGLGPASGPMQTPGMQTPGQGPIGQTRGSQNPPRPAPGVSSSASNQPPAAQQRTMVMPDRMRWIYRDPQGNTQGPWSGLEMHDWYRAGFFSPELLVKKVEDPDYEPLAQLIRRIGNSREPFLVPQIGIPHGEPSQGAPGWGNEGPTGAPSGAQPPFANSFPSFGTTLTAEQQNALERRKQEEQYLMARQKEHLAQQQIMVKQMQMQGQGTILPPQLQHHSSAHSLHSQPSYGSITSPGGYQPSPNQGPPLPGAQGGPGFFDNSFRQGQSASFGPIGGSNIGMMQQEMPNLLQQLNIGRPGQPGFTGADPFGNQLRQDPNHAAAVAIQNERARLAREQAQHDASQFGNTEGEQKAAQNALERLQQFQDLRAQAEEELAAASQQQHADAAGQPAAAGGMPTDRSVSESLRTESPEPSSDVESPQVDVVTPAKQTELSLTEQVQKAQASAKQQQSGSQSPWAKIDTTLPQPFPAPTQPGSPMVAPVAQRKQNLEYLQQETRSGSQTPSVETPSASIAPWAKEPTEAPKGPSLKEIQEMEAKKAAQQEEIAVAARRAALEKEMAAAQAAAAAVPAPGLPSSSTWASGTSPATPTGSAPSVWAKATTGTKPPGLSAAASKKTLQQIQKEEEARKQRAVSTTTTTTPVVGTAALSSGKRYADLASKTTAQVPVAVGGAWTTVGASGKVKAPTAPTPTVPSRSASTTSAPSKAKQTPTPSRSATMGVMANQLNAQDVFKKWAVNELRGDLHKSINVDDFVATLVSLGSDVDILTEAVHSNSQTMDSRHFAEEFVRRRKLADKGVIDGNVSSSPAPEAKSGGGWSEVAKKNPQTPKEEPNTFKVVAAKKKGGKR